MPLNLDHLRAFLIVLEEGSMNRAALRLLRAQPAIGRQIKLLEESVGTPLLERSSTGVRPTAAGIELVEHARRIFREVAQAEAAMTRIGASPTGTVTVGVPTSLVGQLVEPLFSFMQARCPLVRLVILEGDSHMVAAWLQDGVADVGLLPDAHVFASLHSAPCGIQKFCFCGLAKDFQTLPADMSLAEALSYPLALSLPPNRLRQLVDAAAQGIGRTVDPVVTANNEHVIDLMIRKGGIHTIRPRVGAVPTVVDGIAFIPIREPSIDRRLAVVWNSSRPLSAASDATRLALYELTAELTGHA